MSIASEITRINHNIADAYSACDEKGAVLPQALNSANLADTIDSIQTGGNTPVLYAPVISLSGDVISVTNPAANGSFVTAYDVYDMSSGQVRASITGTSYDLSSLPAGDYDFAVKAKGQNFSDSDYSNQLHVSVYSITRSLTGLTADDSAGKIMDGKRYDVTLTPASGYFLPEDILVTMGGRPTGGYSYDSYTGAVAVFGVTGNVVITASASGVNKLRRPAASLSGSSLTVTPPRNADTTVVSVNGTQKYTLSGTSPQTYDLSQVYTDYGIYHISAVSSASGYVDSDPATADYQIGASVVINNGVITLTSIVSGVSSFNIYADGSLLDTVLYSGSVSWSLNMSNYKSMVSGGKHIVELEAIGTGIAPNRSNAVDWFKGVAPVYGVSGLFGSDPALTRTDDALGMMYLINSSSGSVASDFDDAFPWNKTEIVYTEAGKFVSFPEMYFRIGTDSNSKITDVAVSEWPSGSGSWYRVKPFLYGCYGASMENGRMKSVSGVGHTSMTRASYRAGAMNNGSGYIPIDLYHRNVLMLLWWIEFATKDSSSLMTGNISGSGLLETIELRPCGGTDCVNTPSGFEVLHHQMRYHYIEDFIGNHQELIDGVYVSGSNDYNYVTADPGCFTDVSSDKSALPWQNPTVHSNRTVASFGWDADHPFLFMPKSTAFDNTYRTFFCDATFCLSGYPVLVAGSSYESDAVKSGLTYIANTGISSTLPSYGSRLLKLI